MIVTETRLAAKNVRSLVWDGDSLVDWVSGGVRYLLSGEVIPAGLRYAYAFDAAVSLPGSPYAVIYTRLGTKGLVLKNGEVLREINRSFYLANAYEFPVALFRVASGREVLAHCPTDYCRLDIEDLATGELLTASCHRTPSDFFHSRLAASPDGRYLVSAGWVWHPIDEVRLFDVEAALLDPIRLDGDCIALNAYAEESCAAFFPDGRLAVSLLGNIDDQDSPIQEGLIQVFNPDHSIEGIKMTAGVGRLGSIAATGNHHLLALHGHPRLIGATTGTEITRWPQLSSGTQTSSILGADAAVTPFAVDSYRARFAVADAEGITVVSISMRAQ